jgi:alpha-glucosidase
MKKQLVILLWLFLSGIVVSAQTSFLYKKDIAVFYPAQFEADRVLPSLAIIKDLQSMAPLPNNWKIKPEFVKEIGKNVVRIAFDSNADLYGTGEVTGDLKRNGSIVKMWNTDNYTFTKFEGQCLYQSHPWILGVRKDGTSFGIIADNTWKQDFELKNPITITTTGPFPRIIVIEKDTPQEVIMELAELTGKMELPPLWALGYQQCRYSYFPDTRVKEIADEFRKRNIPCDVIWMDIDYMDEFRVFTFDKKLFPDPKSLNGYLHDKGFKSVYMIDPGIKKDENYFVYKQGSLIDAWVKDKNGNEYNGNVWPGMCAFPDFTRPDVRIWWSSLYKEFMSQGIDGVWNDMNEPAVFNTDSTTMPYNNIHLGGEGLPKDIHARYHNVYGMLMVKASRDGILNANPDKRPFVLSRANFLGGQRYGATWTGDNASNWDYLRVSIPMSINLGLSGQPFSGPDIGGFAQNSEPELLANWMAVGAYYPFSRNHSVKGSIDQEPWAMGKKVEDVSRTAINRRYRLLPYLYTQFYKASLTGLPIMQPIFMSDIKDTTLRKEQECFMLGSDLLIIPRWSNKPALPKGDWDILKLEDNDDGYQPYVALRSGAVVPIGKVIQNTGEYSTDSLTLLINPQKDGSATGQLYDDAGDGFAYKKGDYANYHFTGSKFKKKGLKVKIEKSDGQLKKDISHWRVGYVIDNNIIYSAWNIGNECIVKMITDDQDSIDLSKLKMSDANQRENKSLNGLFKRRKIQIKSGENF